MAIEVLFYAVMMYVLVGCVFAAPFVAKGVNRIDPAARASRWGFRLVIFPGAAALWPLLFIRMWRS
jgi:hypothetical protein